MFWERFYSLCLETGVKPNSIREELGVTSPGAMTYWKKGVVPQKRTLNAIAAYFNTTVDYLLGNSDDRHSPAPRGNEKSPAPAGAGDRFTDRQLYLLQLLSMLPEEDQQEMVRQMEYVVSRLAQ